MDYNSTTPSPPSGGGGSTLGDYYEWLVPMFFGIMVFTGVVGNSIVIIVLAKAGQLRTVTNFYIVNLAAADIAFLTLCAPATAAGYSMASFLFGGSRFMCKLVSYLQSVTVQVTCLILTAMSIDRFQAIVRPLKSLKTRTLQTAVIIGVSIWLFALLVYIPVFIYFDITYGYYSGGVLVPLCNELWPSEGWELAFVWWSFVATFALPLLIITVCYTLMVRHLRQRVAPSDGLTDGQPPKHSERNMRQRRRVTWMVLTVVVVFAACWFPIYVFQLWLRTSDSFPFSKAAYNLKVAGHVLSYANSCVNPFIYAFLGESFRKSFRKAFSCCFKKVDGRVPTVGGGTGTGTRQAGNTTLHRGGEQGGSSTRGIS